MRTTGGVVSVLSSIAALAALLLGALYLGPAGVRTGGVPTPSQPASVGTPQAMPPGGPALDQPWSAALA